MLEERELEDNQQQKEQRVNKKSNDFISFVQQCDQIGQNKELYSFSMDQIFNSKTWRDNDDTVENKKEQIFNDTSNIADINLIHSNSPQKHQFKNEQQYCDNQNTTARQLINKDSFTSIRQIMIPSASNDNNDNKQYKDNSKNNLNDQRSKDNKERKQIGGQNGMIQDSIFTLSHRKDSIEEKQGDIHSPQKRKAGKISHSFNNSSSSANQVQINIKLIATIRKKVKYFYKNFTSSGRRSYLTNHNVRNTINDKSDVIQLDIDRFLLMRMVHSLKHSLERMGLLVHKYIQLFNPHSLTSYIILRFFAIYNAIFYFLFSIIIIFNGPEWFQSIWYVVTMVIWILETMFHMNSKIYIENQLVSDRFHIAANYFKSRALYDVIAFILLAALPHIDPGWIFFHALLFLKLFNTMYDYDEIQKDLIMQIKNYYMVSLVNLIIQLFFIGHVVACMYYLVGQIELKWIGLEKTWYDDGLAADYVWWKLYLEAMYWSLTLLTTGSNSASTLLQMFFTTFIMIFTTIIFGYMLNVTGVIISSLNQQNENMRKDLNIINDYMRSNRISKALRSRVNTDIENYYANNMNKQKDEERQILSKISPTLHDQIRMEYSNQILDKFPIFREHFSKKTIQRMSLEFKESYYLPNQIIFLEGQPTDLGLTYIAQGAVSLKSTFMDEIKNQKTLKKLNKGSIFGAINFFTGFAPDKSAISSEFTKVVRIDRNKFIEIVREDERDYQTFCQIKDQLLIYENYEVINQKCLFCSNSTHLEAECHLIHIQKYEIYQKLRFFENKIQQRGSIQRKQIKLQMNKNFLSVKNSIQQFRQQHRQSIEDLVINNSQRTLQTLNTNTDIASSDDEYDYDNEDEDDNSSQENQQYENDNQSIASTTKKDIQGNFIKKTTLKSYHNKREDIFTNVEQKLHQVNSEIAGKYTQNVVSQDNNSQECMQDHGYSYNIKQNQLDQKSIKTIEQEQQQYGGISFQKQNNNQINQNNNQLFSNRQESELINLNSEEDDYVDPLPPLTEKQQQRKQTQLTGKRVDFQSSMSLTSRQKRNSVFLKYRNTVQDIQNQINLLNHIDLSLNRNHVLANQKGYKEDKLRLSLKKQSLLLNENLKQIFQNEVQSLKQSNSVWVEFDRLNDWKYYFPSGNSKLILQRFLKYQSKKLRMLTAKRRQPLLQTIKAIQ